MTWVFPSIRRASIGLSLERIIAQHNLLRKCFERNQPSQQIVREAILNSHILSSFPLNRRYSQKKESYSLVLTVGVEEKGCPAPYHN